MGCGCRGESYAIVPDKKMKTAYAVLEQHPTHSCLRVGYHVFQALLDYAVNKQIGFGVQFSWNTYQVEVSVKYTRTLDAFELLLDDFGKMKLLGRIDLKIPGEITHVLDHHGGNPFRVQQKRMITPLQVGQYSTNCQLDDRETLGKIVVKLTRYFFDSLPENL